jgi:Leucine-rich repeat (LRR) protein
LANLITEFNNSDFDHILNITEINLSDNKLNYIDQNLSSLNNIKRLILRNTSITNSSKLNIEQFLLEEIDLSYNNISYIFPLNFQILTHLKSLKLDYNQLRDISNPSEFRDISSLQTLSLNFNLIKNISSWYFVGLENLTSLDMAWNQIESIQTNSFKDLNSLNSLILSGNKLSTLDLNLFDNTIRLSLVELYNNSIFTSNKDDLINKYTNVQFKFDSNFIIEPNTNNSNPGAIKITTSASSKPEYSVFACSKFFFGLRINYEIKFDLQFARILN